MPGVEVGEAASVVVKEQMMDQIEGVEFALSVGIQEAGVYKLHARSIATKRTLGSSSFLVFHTKTDPSSHTKNPSPSSHAMPPQTRHDTTTRLLSLLTLGSQTTLNNKELTYNSIITRNRTANAV